MHLDCTIERLGNAVVVTPFGDIDRDTAQQLRDQLTAAVGQAGADGVLVDLRHVTFLDSSGVGALLFGRRTAERTGLPFRVSEPTPSVRKVLEITNVWTLLS
jgi:anti-anti-sigma factor